MRIAVMGTGGIGGYFGGRLAAAGHEVAFVARGRQLEALKANGLHVQSELGDLHLPTVEVTDDPSELAPADVVLFGVKLWDTEESAALIKPLLAERTAVISFQNGVVKDDVLRRIIGPEHVVGGVAYIAATIAEPGVIKHTGTLQRLAFGEYDGSASDRVEAFRAACAEAGIDVAVSNEIERTIWEKFVFLVGLSGLTTTTRTPVGEVRSNPRSRAFLRDVMDEAVQVARAQGVPIPAGFADDRLAFVDQAPAEMTSSMHHDLNRGNRLEVAWLSGDVVDRGRNLGIPTPCNRAITDLLAVHADGSAGR
ncbi:ketopantoate reductase family protein [Kribbella sp. NPDC056345]|uniref:ketopantoate reductase family protein n=1 Tax=Kribbella sp. NPDC056345 TaxID=3345789 RepID=UPI0035E0BF71